MSPDEFALALRALGTPLFLDDAGTPTALGTEYAGTADDGTEVRIIQLAARLTTGLRDLDAFVGAVEHHGYLGAGIAGSALFVVEARPDGEPLAVRVAREGVIRPTTLAPLAHAAALQLARSLAAFGAHGLITPDTLRVGTAGKVSFRWSGIVPGLVAAGADAAAVMEHLGATDYLAPEVAAGAPFDARSDVYALGTTLYVATTGRAPFGGRTTASTMAAVLTEDSMIEASPAQRLTAAVLRAIEQDPADRWADAERFARAIEGTPHNRPAAESPRKRRRGSARIAIAAAAVGTILYLLRRLTH